MFCFADTCHREQLLEDLKNMGLSSIPLHTGELAGAGKMLWEHGRLYTDFERATTVGVPRGLDFLRVHLMVENDQLTQAQRWGTNILYRFKAHQAQRFYTLDNPFFTAKFNNFFTINRAFEEFATQIGYQPCAFNGMNPNDWTSDTQGNFIKKVDGFHKRLGPRHLHKFLILEKSGNYVAKKSTLLEATKRGLNPLARVGYNAKATVGALGLAYTALDISSTLLTGRSLTAHIASLKVFGLNDNQIEITEAMVGFGFSLLGGELALGLFVGGLILSNILDKNILPS